MLYMQYCVLWQLYNLHHRHLLMLKCWEEDVKRRICFEEIVSELIEEVGKGYVIDNLDDYHDYAAIKSI